MKNMCQAYEGERNYIVAGENIATKRGFAAAKLHKPKDSNPFYSLGIYDREAWNHGWESWHERLLPWALDREYRKITGAWQTQDIQPQFKDTGKLPDELETILAKYSY